jgi:hypothetical protein
MKGTGNQDHSQRSKEKEPIEFIPAKSPNFPVLVGKKETKACNEAEKKCKKSAIASCL